MKSRTRLSDFTFTFHFPALEKEMATHSSILAWRIPGMGEPGGLPSMGLHRVGHDWNDLAAAAAAAAYILKFSYSFWMLYSIFFFHPVFSLYFSLGVISWPTFKLTDSSAVSSLLVSPSKACFISVTVFVISNNSLWFFLSFHLSTYIIHLFLHVVHCFLFLVC